MLTREEIFTFDELTRRLPRINGKKLHVSALHRWGRKGVRGVQLEFVMLGGHMMTSLEAVERFSLRVAEAPPPERPYGPRRRHTSRSLRERQIAAAEQFVRDAAGGPAEKRSSGRKVEE